MVAVAKPKTVLLLIETLNRGGIENVLLRLIPKLKQEGWSSIVLTIRDGGEMLPEYEQAGIRVISLGQKNFISPRTLSLIYHYAKELEPNLIMTTLFKADVIGRLFLRFIIRRPVVPYLVTTYNHRRYRIARVFEWLTKPFATHYIANSEAVQLFYEKHLGVKRGKIVVAPNGVDTITFQEADGKELERQLALPKDAFVVTCVANLAANKGQSDLLAAFDEVFADNDKAYLLLVGDGEQRQALTNEREALRSKERILLLGRRTDVPAILKITTIFALPTLFEGMSTALLEAMAAKKAIITTNIAENKVLLTHDKSAILVPPSNRSELAKALRHVSADGALRERLSQQAFSQVEENYSITNMAGTFADIFDVICHIRPGEQAGVIHVISSLESGGAENMLLRTLPLLNEDSFKQTVITLFRPGELAAEFEKRGISIINIGLKNLYDIAGYRRLVREVKNHKPRLVITYLFHASLIGRLYLHQRLSIPVIPFLRTTYNSPRYFKARLFERVTKNLTLHYFANSEAVKDYYVKNIGVASNSITVIPNGIDVSIYESANNKHILQELGLPPKHVVITCVANLASNKGHTYLLAAFEAIFHRHPEAFLLIVGEGQERLNLERQIEHFKSKNQVKFLGRRSDVPEILAISDIFILPTLFEGLSNAILEAMAAKCAVITTDIPENRVIIKNNQTGLLVPTRSSRAIEASLNRLLEDKSVRDRLGRSANTFIKSNFDLQVIAEELECALKSFAANESVT